VIIFVVGGMLLYCLIDYRKYVRQMNLQPQVRRMANNAVWQHLFLIVTFAVLIISGFSLRHSEAWWANLLFGWEGGSELRGVIHRIAAVLFIVTVLWHLIYLATQIGRQFLRAMMPARLDLTQLIQMVGYNIGKQKERPAFGRFSYVEKAEYWALAWGTALMIITGFTLWFDNEIIRWFSKGFLDVMLVIHYYEAWLAMLSILVWHLYATVLNPAVYPMNPSWLTGKMPVEQYLHEHPGDSALVQSGSADSPESTAENSLTDMSEERNEEQ
jgi:cytochrome b subunit of formate dehydrogenase